MADAESYREGGAAPAPRTADPVLLYDYLSRPLGLVVELSLTPETADKLGTIGALATRLRATELFARVDILPSRARQALADPTVFAAQNDFALSLEGRPFEHSVPPPPPESRRSDSFLLP